MLLNKTKARIAAVQLLYQKKRINHPHLGEIILLELNNDLSKENKNFIKKLLLFLEQKESIIDICIQKSLINWQQSRIQLIINVILKLALAEKLLYPKISKKIIINDFLEITRIFAEEKIVKFCNGVLDKAIVELEKI